MAVAVFGQLDHLLRERNLTIDDLRRQIEERYEVTVDEAVLAELAGNQRLGQMDPTVVGAVATVLGISLDDILFIVVIPGSVTNPPTRVNTLTEEETWRVWALLGMQQKRTRSDDEQHELESISEEGTRRVRELFWRRRAEHHGVPFEDLLDEIEEDERVVAAMKRGEWPDEHPNPTEATERAEEQRAPASR